MQRYLRARLVREPQEQSASLDCIRSISGPVYVARARARTHTLHETIWTNSTVSRAPTCAADHDDDYDYDHHDDRAPSSDGTCAALQWPVCVVRGTRAGDRKSYSIRTKDTQQVALRLASCSILSPSLPLFLSLFAYIPALGHSILMRRRPPLSSCLNRKLSHASNAARANSLAITHRVCYCWRCGWSRTRRQRIAVSRYPLAAGWPAAGRAQPATTATTQQNDEIRRGALAHMRRHLFKERAGNGVDEKQTNCSCE